ncbi:MAG: Lrp/AsnC family transcriptional regulator [Pseudomonadota bacterium]
MREIDALDRKLLRELQQDAALPLEQLGERIGLSRNACWRRMRTLEKTGVIRGRVVLLNPETLGLNLTVFIQIKAATHDTEWMTRLTQAVRGLPEIQGVYRMTGDLDYLLRARVGDMADYDRLYQKLVSLVPMRDVSASFVMEEIKETTALPL